MKKAYLKWLVPIAALCVMVGVACFIYGGVVKKNAVMQTINMLSEKVTRSLYSADLSVKTAEVCNNTAAVSFELMRFDEDKDKIVKMLKHAVSYENAQTAVVCDQNGMGYNEKGDSISLSGTPMFEEVKNNYSRGGKGFVLVSEEGYFRPHSIAIVNHVGFADGMKGFIITSVYYPDLHERIFPQIENGITTALIGLNGTVIAGDNEGTNFWENTDAIVPKDTIKLNISQRKKYFAEVPGYGYVLMVPSDVTNGAAVLLIENKTIAEMTALDVVWYRVFVGVLFGAICLYILILLLSHYVERMLSKFLGKKEKEETEFDEQTGLLNEEAFILAIDKYSRLSEVNSGVLFALNIDILGKDDTLSKDLDNQIKEFSGKLTKNYRSSDFLGRGKNGEFFIFLRDISEEKDIRKQTDALQLFMHDIKADNKMFGTKVNVSAGRAIFTKDGGCGEEIVSAARDALAVSKGDGRNSIVFYK
ncbi:GGDEF domain-containing protein [Butyrivibrio sp. YAB3001]|uniref:GGDEF domain-containing protein n=1 Tax=Butyrivibrio sp. YAB3001 TaxID=1520812 RepID=UPI0008F63A09|nr:GGDEF domain-containing protein [Butyrivibrio sp. YAB3001]SFC09341.1 GGDEF domain-containing protein, diguanylate cyclase (c-di-GMP synthetase) or its enzymatically inactive variants [Butyrivibrio sp. YAB3001]